MVSMNAVNIEVFQVRITFQKVGMYETLREVHVRCRKPWQSLVRHLLIPPLPYRRRVQPPCLQRFLQFHLTYRRNTAVAHRRPYLEQFPQQPQLIRLLLRMLTAILLLHLLPRRTDILQRQPMAEGMCIHRRIPLQVRLPLCRRCHLQLRPPHPHCPALWQIFLLIKRL